MPTYSNPIGLTPNIKLKKFGELANPGSAQLNENWDKIDSKFIAVDTFITASISSKIDTSSFASLNKENVFIPQQQFANGIAVSNDVTMGWEQSTGESYGIKFTTEGGSGKLNTSYLVEGNNPTWTLPNKSGTIALLSDISNSSGSVGNIDTTSLAKLHESNTFNQANVFDEDVQIVGDLILGTDDERHIEGSIIIKDGTGNTLPINYSSVEAWNSLNSSSIAKLDEANTFTQAMNIEEPLTLGVRHGTAASGQLNLTNVRTTGYSITTITPSSVQYPEDVTLELPNASGEIALTSDITWTNLGEKPSTFTPSAHSHWLADIDEQIDQNVEASYLGNFVARQADGNPNGRFATSVYGPESFAEAEHTHTQYAPAISADARYIFTQSSIAASGNAQINMTSTDNPFYMSNTMVSFVKVSSSAAVPYRFEFYQSGSVENILYASQITTGSFIDNIPFTMYRPDLSNNNLYFRFFNLGSSVTNTTLTIIARGI